MGIADVAEMNLFPGTYVCLDGIHTEEGIERRIVRVLSIREVHGTHILASDGRRYNKARIRDVYIDKYPHPYPFYETIKLLEEESGQDRL